MNRPLRAVVVDDEPLARRRLRALIGAARGVTWVGEAENGRRALRLVDEVEPELLFLDIEMPGMSGLEVARLAEERLQVVFTTAFEQHAIRAFDLHAADYLLKPFSVDRLQAAVDRARSLESLRNGPIRRIFARERGRIIPISVSTILRMEADGDYVHVHCAEREYLITSTLSDVHARMDQDAFVRVHRSHVVNLDAVVAFEPWEGSRLRLRLRNGETIVASRGRSKELRDGLR